MTAPIQFSGEDRSNQVRRTIAGHEPAALRTFTPTQAVVARSAGCFHWTPEGRRLYDYSSGVLVANLGHNPRRWMQRLAAYMGWKPEHLSRVGTAHQNWPGPADRSAQEAVVVGDAHPAYFEAVTLTAYNAVTEIESQAVERLVNSLQSSPGGSRLETVMWAASGSEAIQKALWACLHLREDRDIIVATRHGFHGKKGLAGAVTGSETDRDRDPRVKFISFPMEEVDDVSRLGIAYQRPEASTAQGEPEPRALVGDAHPAFDLTKFEAELDALAREFKGRINCLITEPYLGGGGSYHPPAEYLQLLQRFCRNNDALFILDEVQSNFGRTGRMYAFEKYGIEPDIVCLGKGLGNGVPVSAAVGPAEVFASLKYGEGSDTWSANPLACAAVLATLDEFETTDVLEHAARISQVFFAGLERLKETGIITKVRGEGMVFGVECGPAGGLSAEETANAVVETCYLGEEGGDGIHLLGPLAGTVLRVSPPLTITEDESAASLQLFYEILRNLSVRLETDRGQKAID